jgi:hypothetical protein
VSLDADAGVVVAGDLNDFQFSTPSNILSGDVLTDLVNTLPMEEQYTYIFDGNSQVLDHILVSGYLFTSASPAFDIVHANAEFDTDFRPTDHEPLVVQLTLPVLVPAIELVKTVGTDSGSCAPTNSILVPAGGGGTDVYYCYEATNIGDVTFTSHSLADSELGTIFADMPYDLGPGDSVDTVSLGLVISATITETTVNTATWTASDAAGGQLNATATATVVVEPPTSVSLSSIGEPISTSMLPALVLVSSLLAIAGFTIMRKRQRAG